MHEDSWPENWSGRSILLITRMITDRIGLRLVLLALLRHLFVALLTNSHSFPNILQAFVRGHK